MDWVGLETEITKRARSPDDAAALIATARALVAAHGERVAPKDVDAFVRARSDDGASAAELATVQRAGDALVRFTRASVAPPPASEPDAAPVDLPVPDAPSAPAPAMPPEVLAKMPASFFAGATGGEEDTRVWMFMRRYAWVFDALAMLLGLVLFVTLLRTYAPITATMPDLRRGFVRRVVGWVAGLTFASGAAGFAQRLGLLEGPLYGRFGEPTFRLRFIQARGLALVRGVMIIGSGILLLILSGPGSMFGTSAPTEARQEPAAWPTWMTELGVIARPPGTWSYEHTSTLQIGDRTLRVAWLREGDVAPATHAIVVGRGESTLVSVHPIAMALSHEIPRRTDGIVCQAARASTRIDVLCIRDEPPSPFVMACATQHPALICVASWDVGAAAGVTALVEQARRDVFYDDRPAGAGRDP